MRHTIRAALAATALAACALALPLATPALAHDVIRVGQTFLVGSTDPTRGSAGWALASHGVGEKLFMVDRDGKLVPELATGAERTGELSWTITLAPGRSFSDGSPVTAAALAKGFDNTFALSKTAAATGGKLGFRAAGDLTLEVTTEKPVPVIAALFAEWPLVAYTLGQDGAILYTGPYAIKALKVDQQLDLVPNPHHAGATKRSPITLRRFGDAQTMALAFEAGELDLAFGLPSETLARLKANPDLSIRSFAVGYQYYGFLNNTRPALAEAPVRQAIDLAIDRSQLVAAIGGGTPATGAFAPYFSFAPKVARATDLSRAEKLLDDAGWTKDANGMRNRDGRELRLKIVTYPQRPDLVTMMPVVKAALAKAGIAADTQVVENSGEAAAAGDFDLFLWAQHTAPNGDPAFFFNSMLKSDGPLNHARWKSAAFDRAIAGHTTPATLEQRAEIALDAQAIVFAETPVTFLVSPEWHVGVSKRLAGYEPWGSDYHVIRANMGESHP